jgi:hypothetical protein
MALGPLVTYVPPGVYTRTLTEANAANLVAGLRIPVLIGVGQEQLLQSNLESIRGSSSNLDTQILSENAAARFVLSETNPNNPTLGVANGLVTKLRVRNFPIVDGNGYGRVTNDVRAVSVSVNGLQVAVGAVQGSSGYVTLQVPAQSGDDVRVTYFFRRTDTAFTDTVSDQVTQAQAELTSPAVAPFVIATGASTLSLIIDGVERAIVLTAGTYTASALKVEIDSNLVPGLATAVFTDNRGLDHLTLIAASEIEIGGGSANGAFGLTQGKKTTRTRSFRVFQRPIVDGTDGGITTNDTTKVTVLVNGAQKVPTAVDGTNGVVTLALPPPPGATVAIQYFANTWQDTFDYLPNTLVTDVVRCGFATGRSDFIQGQDFVVENPSADVSVIHWGTSVSVANTSHTTGTTVLNSTQLLPTLVDDKLYMAATARYVNTGVVPAAVATSEFVLPQIPTTGNGRDTPLGQTLFAAVANNRISLPSNRPDLVQAWAGRDVHDALSRSQLTVLEVDSVTLRFKVREIVPPDQTVFATFNYSRISDDVCTITNKVAGPLGSGEYEVRSSTQGSNLFQVRFGTKSSLPEIVQWPRGAEQVPDAFHAGAGTPVNETVTVTFGSTTTTNARFTNDGQAPYDLYAGASDRFRVTINGTAFAANLNAAAPAYLVSKRVALTGGNVIIPASPNNVLSLNFGDAVSASKGSITAVAGSLLIDGETFTLDDGVNDPVVFEFDDDSNVASGNIAVEFTGGDSAATVASAIQAAINGVVGDLLITAGAPTGALVPLTNDSTGEGGNEAVTDTVANAGFIVRGMTGGNGEVSIELTPGSRSPAQIVTEIDAVFDTVFGATTLASTVSIGAGHAVFIIKSATTPASLPGGFDHSAYVEVRPGTVETVLGFTTFQRADGTPTATNKPATLVGTLAETFNITASVNDQLNVQVDGVDYVIPLTAGVGRTASQIVTDINGVVTGLASVGTLANLNHVRLTSSATSSNSRLLIKAGSANATLGFTTGDEASQTRVTAQEIVDVLLNTSSPAAFTSEGFAWVQEVDGREFITVESIDTGIASTVLFADGTTSAFNSTTGLGITPGDGDNGEAAKDNFVVTSTNPQGSAGTGYPGQTYTDARTGLRFTVLQSSVGTYTDTGAFTLDVSQTWKVNPSVPYLSVPGLELIVTDTVGVGLNDTANVQTFNPGGLEPAIGDSYFISYHYMKQDFSTRLFAQFKTIEANFGALSGENRVTLAAYLMILNGAVLVGIKQILKAPNSNQATDAAFISALKDLEKPLPGNVKPDVIVPLATSSAVYSQTLQHVEVMSTIRNQSERMAYIGFAAGSGPTTAQTIARSLESSRIIAIYPDSAVVTLTDELGNNADTLVDGTFLAAAVAGSAVSPAFDVATPFTRRRIQGFTRLPRILDAVEANLTATSGVTLLEDLDPVVRIRQGLTTDMSTILTRLPTVTQIADFVQQSARGTLDVFIGTKFLASRTNDVEVSLTAMFNSLVQAEIVGAFTGISAVVDPDDPTILRVVAYYQPIFPLLYIVVSFNLRSSLV